MKKLFTLLLALVATSALWAEDFQVNGIYYKILKDKTNEVEVTFRGSYSASYTNEYSGSVTIPETVTYNGTTNSVTSIGNYAFEHCSSLTSITIPNSVTSIGDNAFGFCSSLTSPVYNAHCFAYMPTSYSGAYTIPEGIKQIAGYAFSSCSSLTSVTIPNSVTSIGNYAFRYCKGLTSPVFNAHCFAYMPTSYSGAYAIPEGIKQIAGGAFENCSGLTSVTIPNSVTSIGKCAFEDCSGLTSVTIPNSVTSIGYSAFYGCSSLPVENSLRYADTYLVEAVDKTLSTYSIKEGTKWIGIYAFKSCSSLTSITIPNSVKSIGDIAFAYCSGLTFIESLAEVPPTLETDVFYNVPKNIPVYVPCGSVSAYQSAEGWKAFTNILEPLSGQCGDDLYWAYDEANKTISITGSGDMYNYTKSTQPWLLFQEQITEVTTSNTTTSIGTSAFEGCVRLAKVSLGYGMEDIAANAFAKCKRLYDIYCYASYPPFAEESSFANYNVYLYVPCENQRDYILDVVWGDFKYIECIGAESDETGGDDVTVTPRSNDVTITWPIEDDADTYSIVITKDGEVFCTLTFNSNGQLVSIAFAPGRQGSHPTQYAEAAANGYRFTVTGLDESTKYAYNLDVKDSTDKTIKSYEGVFTTQSTTAVDEIQSTTNNVKKIFRDGQLLIIRDGKTYNAQGAAL